MARRKRARRKRARRNKFKQFIATVLQLGCLLIPLLYLVTQTPQTKSRVCDIEFIGNGKTHYVNNVVESSIIHSNVFEFRTLSKKYEYEKATNVVKNCKTVNLL